MIIKEVSVLLYVHIPLTALEVHDLNTFLNTTYKTVRFVCMRHDIYSLGAGYGTDMEWFNSVKGNIELTIAQYVIETATYKKLREVCSDDIALGYIMN